MYSARRGSLVRDIHILESLIHPLRRRTCSLSTYIVPFHQLPCSNFSTSARITAKTVSKRKVKDLAQGRIEGEPLPAITNEDVRKETMLQGVRRNMDKFPNYVLVTRVGNFYELYYEHATQYAPLLNLKCTEKGKDRTPMAGFQYLYLGKYVKVLVEDLKKNVAICEEFHEFDDAGKLAYPIDRRVARCITAGTLIDEEFLDATQNNFLVSISAGSDLITSGPNAVARENSTVGLAWIDLSTGDFFTQQVTKHQLPSALLRVGAREVVISDELPAELKMELKQMANLPSEMFTEYQVKREYSSINQWNDRLESVVSEEESEAFTSVELSAAHQVLDYVQELLFESKLKLRPPQRRQLRDTLNIDRSSLKGLEILETSRDGLGKGSLLNTIRRTVTKSGSRLLKDRLTSPSTSVIEIDSRLDLVTTFARSTSLRSQLLVCLEQSHDVQRLVQKFSLNKGDADDMLLLANTVQLTNQVLDILQHFAGIDLVNQSFTDLTNRIQLQGCLKMAQTILTSIDEDALDMKHRQEEEEDAEVAGAVRDILANDPEELKNLPKSVQKQKSINPKDQVMGSEEIWIMRKNASPTLQQLHDELQSMYEEKDKLEDSLRSELSAPTLTLKWTPGLSHICHIRKADGFDQTRLEALKGRLVSASKTTKAFHVPAWTRFGEKMEQLKYNIRIEENQIFVRLRKLIIKNLVQLRRNAMVLDEIDVSIAFAILAIEQNWNRPVLNNGNTHKIIGGRHPTVKIGLEEKGKSFISNDLLLDDKEKAWLITGPNMAGKSTFLRQNALITILAQVGSYVPAEYAEIGIVDQIFSRIGAADDLFRDQSTFMVEMLETANILNHATEKSFVIMDEVGRGTTPEDGTAVSFASLHYLYYIKRCRTLFATHFHALADMTDGWDRLGMYCTDVFEDESGKHLFLHKLHPGVNRQSHALKVAKMAGMPESALDIAKSVLQKSNVAAG